MLQLFFYELQKTVAAIHNCCKFPYNNEIKRSRNKINKRKWPLMIIAYHMRCCVLLVVIIYLAAASCCSFVGKCCMSFIPTAMETQPTCFPHFSPKLSHPTKQDQLAGLLQLRFDCNNSVCLNSQCSLLAAGRSYNVVNSTLNSLIATRFKLLSSLNSAS